MVAILFLYTPDKQICAGQAIFESHDAEACGDTDSSSNSHQTPSQLAAEVSER